ncbi:class II aldolase/adducin family protein [Candidimonas nitroreducens]|uniref:Aldolase n=1 Tax=Candidimonas nitroreducens TaxID=683354 RepID=A0A225M5J3_9BURK|nr:class II aldolase/adducin family protein [Candidimonas nitroreducens]OWT54821.1 aldolase [Candidimonas nitroreducens]
MAQDNITDDATRAGLEDLVLANRILAENQVLDGFGHVSLRSPARADRYYLSRSLAPGIVTLEDLVEFDLDSNPVAAEKRKLYLERFIHGEIYRRRPDVQAIVHSHSATVVPFTVSSVPLKPIYHMAGFLADGAPVFDIAEKFGHTDMLVTCHEHGAALAESLGEAASSLMRGHGFVAVGSTLPIAVYRAIYTQQNAALQETATNLGGEIRYLDPEEGRLADRSIQTVMQRPWGLWTARAKNPKA